MKAQRISPDGKSFDRELALTMIEGNLSEILKGFVQQYRMDSQYDRTWMITLNQEDIISLSKPAISYTECLIKELGGKGTFTVDEKNRKAVITYREPTPDWLLA